MTITDVCEFKPQAPDSIILIRVPRAALCGYRWENVAKAFPNRPVFVMPDDMSLEEVTVERMEELGWTRLTK